jgi:hypothetical protein
MKIPLPKKRRYRIALYIVSTLLVLFAIDLILVNAWRHFTIGYDTTRITAPLKSDGTPDYLRYLDEQCAQGVTSDNNAFIPYAKAFMAVSERVKDETYRRLDIQPPMETSIGDSFSSYMKNKIGTTAAQDWQKYSEEEDLIRKQPWAPADHPNAVQWLTASEKALNTYQQMSMRPRWYFPISHEGTMISVLLPSLGPIRMMSDMAATRAMLNVHEGRYPEARADLMAIRRVARSLATSFTIIEHLVAMAIETNALNVEGALLAKLPPEQLKEHIAELDSLSPWPSPALTADFERFTQLDSLVYVACHPAGALRFEQFSQQETEPSATATLLRILTPAHINAAMLDANQFADCAGAIANAPSPIERHKLAINFEQDVQSYAAKYTGLLHDPARRLVGIMIPAQAKFFQMIDIGRIKTQLVRIAAAIEQYRADTGIYPDSLAPLAPKYLPTIPADGFTDQPLHYQRNDTGYLLYSVGPNGTDDAGLSRDPKQPKADDIAVHP